MTPLTDPVDFLVRRDDFRTTRLAAADPTQLEPGDGEVLLRVDHFAFTANNVTYAAAGDMLHYWDFFPAEEGWGRIPVWGFGDVVASRCPDVAEGVRFYGYYPMSTHLRVQPVGATDEGFSDGVGHRSGLSPVYNRYRNMAAEPGFTPDAEDATMLLQPLFTTSFLIDDSFAESDFFGADTVVLSSASSKTSFGLAFQLARRKGLRVVGLTSPRHTAFVEGLGCYDAAVSYDDIASLDASRPAIFVDMAGNGAVQSAVHHHFGPKLVHSCSVGMTHWEQGKRETDLPGAKPSFFFAPDRVRQRFADWGPDGFQERVGAAFAAFRELAGRSLRVVRSGRSEVERVVLDAVEGRTPPDEGHVVSLQAD